MIQLQNLRKAGFVSKASGFDGSILCALENVRPGMMNKQKFIFIIIDGLPVPFLIEEMDVNDDSAIIKLEDVNNEKEARKISQKEIYIETSSKKTVDVNTWDELTGFTISDSSSGKSGVIKMVEEYPAQIIATCEFESHEVLIPLNEDIVTDINKRKKTVTVILPDGLLDIYMTQ